MKMIIRSSVNLHKTSIIALDGLQVWSIPIRLKCSISEAPWPSIPARIHFFKSAVSPVGPKGANQTAVFGVICVPGALTELSVSLSPLFKLCKKR